MKKSGTIVNSKWLLGGLTMLTFVFIFSCSSGKNIPEFENVDELAEFVDNGTFEIQNDWAQPLRGATIDLVGNPNYIRFKEDSVNIFLPYFGVRQFGGGYSSEGGIKYKGPIKNLQIEQNQENKNVVLEFDADRGTENLHFIITLYPNGRARTSVNSNQRDGISYTGFVKELPEEARGTILKTV